jgi:hypothetical protein
MDLDLEKFQISNFKTDPRFEVKISALRPFIILYSRSHPSTNLQSWPRLWLAGIKGRAARGKDQKIGQN